MIFRRRTTSRRIGLSSDVRLDLFPDPIRAARLPLYRADEPVYNPPVMRPATISAFGLGWIFLGASLVMGDAREAWRFRDDRLENGLRVLTIEDHHSPIINIQVWYHVGSKDEDPTRQGFAHMFEHMMFRGSDRIGPQDHFKYLQRYGAQVNGYTSFDQTVYWETLPAAQLDVALWLEAERMGRLRIDEEYFAAEREVVKEELRMRVLNRPYGSLREQLHAAAFDVHPYKWTPIGRLDHLNAATADELRKFFKTFYTPNNATLVVVGDIRHEEVLAKARQYLGPVPRAADPPRVTAVEPPMAGPKRIEVTDKAPAPLVACIYHTPSAVDRDSVCADLLADILGSGQSSRLYRHLVQGKEIAVSASAYNHAMEQAGLLVVSATLKPGVTVEDGEKAIREEIKALLEKGIESRELEKVRNQEVASYVRSGETVQGRAGQLGFAAVILGDVNRVNTDLDRLRAVTTDEVMAMARRVLTENNCLALLVRPEEKKPADQEVADKSAGKKEPVVDWPRPNELPQGQAPKPIDIPLPLTDRLENGLEVMVVRDPSTPAVTVSFNALVGSREDPDDMAGLAQVTLNTLRRGDRQTQRRPVGRTARFSCDFTIREYGLRGHFPQPVDPHRACGSGGRDAGRDCARSDLPGERSGRVRRAIGHSPCDRGERSVDRGGPIRGPRGLR